MVTKNCCKCENYTQNICVPNCCVINQICPQSVAPPIGFTNLQQIRPIRGIGINNLNLPLFNQLNQQNFRAPINQVPIRIPLNINQISNRLPFNTIQQSQLNRQIPLF